MQRLRVCELFAGVGGFRVGLENTGHYKVVWSNQWEPSTKTQHASMVYEARFGPENHSAVDIEKVPTDEIPDHDVLVGGFPCQDYSVATTLNSSKGLVGKKGVLWWSIHRILKEKKQKPRYLFLENVDRLLKSPSSQRGRDFAIMLKSLSELGYAVEWRVINAADYGMPQRRKRVFFLAYHQSTQMFQAIKKAPAKTWLETDGVFAMAFPTKNENKAFETFALTDDIATLSKHFNKGGNKSPFKNCGIFIGNHVITTDVDPNYNGPYTVLEDILQNGEATDDFFISIDNLKQWKYLKGAKRELRTSRSGHQYHYAEGSMVFPDALDRPSRTIITGEGGKAPSRFKHVVQTKRGLRRLTPVELERLNMFPDDHTKLEGISAAKRAFFMGNALVVGIIKKTGKVLFDKIEQLSRTS